MKPLREHSIIGELNMPESTESHWTAHHWETNTEPDGGLAYGTGFTIAWQRGSEKEEKNGASPAQIVEVCLDRLAHEDKMSPSAKNKQAIALLKQCLSVLG